MFWYFFKSFHSGQWCQGVHTTNFPCIRCFVYYQLWPVLKAQFSQVCILQLALGFKTGRILLPALGFKTGRNANTCCSRKLRYGQHYLIHSIITQSIHRGSTRASCLLQEFNLGGDSNNHSSQPPNIQWTQPALGYAW